MTSLASLPWVMMTQQHDLGSSDPASCYHCQWQGMLARVVGTLSNTSLHNGSLLPHLEETEPV